MELHAWLCLALAFSLAPSAQMVELRSPRITNWGNWQGWNQCEEGTYAAGIQIKVEKSQGFSHYGDDTALNAVALYCLPINWNSIGTAWIMSGEGPWGDWHSIKWCPRGQVIVGFQLRSEKTLHAGLFQDDVAAVNFAAYCGSPFNAPDHSNRIEGDTPAWGQWTTQQWCPPSYAVCGINTQIDPDHDGKSKDHDDTGLNNVDLRCCEVTYSCKPDAELVTVETIDNTNGVGDMTYEYTVRTSFTKTSSTSKTLTDHEKTMIGNKISSELGAADSGLSAKLSGEMSINHEMGSTRSLQTMVQQTSQHETEKKIGVKIPKGKQFVLKQLVFTCGGYRMAIDKTINDQVA